MLVALAMNNKILGAAALDPAELACDLRAGLVLLSIHGALHLPLKEGLLLE